MRKTLQSTQKTSSATTSDRPIAQEPLFFKIFAVATLITCVLLILVGYSQPVIMGIVQGLGEFLPISSSAHLILVPWFFGWQDQSVNSLSFDIALHLGTLIALTIYFWHDWLSLLQAVPDLVAWSFCMVRGDRSRSLDPSAHLLGSILVATIPAGIAGLLLEQQAERSLRAPLLIAATLTVLGLLLYIADRWRPEQEQLERISWRHALLIGLAQACALIPGVSRSGATITMGRFLTFDRSTAARFSFLLSGPITGAAVLFKLDDLLRISQAEIGLFVIGTLVSAAVGALAIRFLLASLRRLGFGIFALYRVVLAVSILLVYFIRG